MFLNALLLKYRIVINVISDVFLFGSFAQENIWRPRGTIFQSMCDWQTSRALLFFGVRSAHLSMIFRVVCALKWALNFQKLSRLVRSFLSPLLSVFGSNGPVRSCTNNMGNLKDDLLFCADWKKGGLLRFHLKECALLSGGPSSGDWSVFIFNLHLRQASSLF